MKKKLLSVLLAGVMLVVSIPAVAFADTTSPISVDEVNKYIFANGNDLTLEDEEDGTAIYVDGSIVDITIGEDTDGTDGYDLSEYIIFGGSQDVITDTTTSITVNGGEVKGIYAGGSAVLTDDVDAKIQALEDIISTTSEAIANGLYDLDVESLETMNDLIDAATELVEELRNDFDAVNGGAEDVIALAEQFIVDLQDAFDYILTASTDYATEVVTAFADSFEAQLTEYVDDLVAEAEETLEDILMQTIAIATFGILGVSFDNVDDVKEFVDALEEVAEFATNMNDLEDDLTSLDGFAEALFGSSYNASLYITEEEVQAIVDTYLAGEANIYDVEGFYADIKANEYTSYELQTLYVNNLGTPVISYYYSNPYYFWLSGYITYNGYLTSIKTDIMATIEDNMEEAGATAESDIITQFTDIIEPLNVVLSALGYETLDEDASVTDIISTITSLSDITEKVSSISEWADVFTDLTSALTDFTTDVTSDPTTAYENLEAAMDTLLTEDQQLIVDGIIEDVVEMVEAEATELAQYAIDEFELAVEDAITDANDAIVSPQEKVEEILTSAVESLDLDELEASLEEIIGDLALELDPDIFTEIIEDVIDDVIAYMLTTDATIDGIIEIVVDAITYEITPIIMEMLDIEFEYIDYAIITVNGGSVGFISSNGLDLAKYVDYVDIYLTYDYEDMIETLYVEEYAGNTVVLHIADEPVVEEEPESSEPESSEPESSEPESSEPESSDDEGSSEDSSDTSPEADEEEDTDAPDTSDSRNVAVVVLFTVSATGLLALLIAKKRILS